MKYSSRLIHLFLLLLGLISPLFSMAEEQTPADSETVRQTPSSVPPVDQQAEPHWQWLSEQADQLDQLISRQMSDRSTRNLLKTNCERSQSVNYREQALLKEADLSRQDLGLYFDAGIRDEWDADFESEERQRAYVGLTWRVLEDGYREKRHRANLAETRAETEVLQSKLDLRQALENCRYDSTRDSFAPVWLPLLTLKERFLAQLFAMQKESYLMGGLYLDDLLDSQRELKSILEHYRMLQTGLDRQLDEVGSGMPPLLDMDMAEIRRRITDDPEKQRLIELRRSILDEQIIANDDKRLRFYLRYNIDEDREENGPTVGAAFSMPLAGGRYSESVVDLHKKELEQELMDEQRRRSRRADLAYGELLEQRQRVVKQNYRYLAAYEQLRRSIGRHHWLPQEGGFKSAATQMTTLIEGAVELMRAVEEMYRRVHRVFARSGVAYSTELVLTAPLKNSFYRARRGERSIYIWSDSFTKLPNGVIHEFLRAKGISEVVLSGNARIPEPKLLNFINKAQQQGIDIQTLVGDNGWLKRSRQQSLLDRLEHLGTRSGYLHIDVEPHTLPDFKQNRRKYLDRYQQLITAIEQRLGEQVKLAVSVPLHWDSEDYQYLDRHVDRVYLMAYEINRVDSLKRRLAKVLPHLSVAKVVVALRPEDFMHEVELESVIEELASAFAIEQFALHDLDSYLQLSDGQ
ncbi:MAG: hypothetical protein AB2551_11135 [Candidatus Thiodiazotropha sp.]